MEIEDQDIKQKKRLFFFLCYFFPSNLVRWWSNFPLMFSADLGQWKVGNNYFFSRTKLEKIRQYFFSGYTSSLYEN